MRWTGQSSSNRPAS